MAKLNLHKDSCADFTVVSNLFIDRYMRDANDAQLKVYLYLTRMLSANLETSVSDIADKFNHTEKDVMRSLRYWEKQGVLTLEYDQGKNLVGIFMNSLSGETSESQPATARSIVLSSNKVAPFAPDFEVTLPESQPQPDAPITKPVFSAEQMKSFKSRSDFKQLRIVAEKYFARTLKMSEIQSLMFYLDTLHFSEDLVISLLEYCIDRGKTDFHYIDSVAIGWAEDGVTTPEQIAQSTGKYDKNVYVIMNELGKTTSPTSTELEFINRWLKEYAFSMDIILEACQRTVLATDRHRLEYAERILGSWKKQGIHLKSEISQMDELHDKKKASSKAASKTAAAPNKFNQFSQNEYDFDDLEKKLISN